MKILKKLGNKKNNVKSNSVNSGKDKDSRNLTQQELEIMKPSLNTGRRKD